VASPGIEPGSGFQEKIFFRSQAVLKELKEFKEVALLFAAMNIAYDINPAAGAMES